MLRIENKKKKKKKKKKKRKEKKTGFEPRTPAWESNVTATAPTEPSFYIITYNS